MAIQTAQAFLEALERSALVEPAQLDAARQAASGAADAQALARQLVQQGILTRWQAGQILVGRSSFLIGRYKLIDLLGKGGMGNVFLARHTVMNRLVALKMISRQLGQDAAMKARFFAEARAVAALDHPNIVHAYSVDSEGDRYYLVMEFIEGTDLERLVQRDGPLDFELAADCIRQAADGLAHAHGKGMIHCDVKPANLLLNAQGVVKILDLGMARLVDEDPQLAGSSGGGGNLLGTVDYMAPEQALADAELDHRADLYSLGCTLYYLLTGHPPFPEGTLHERILKHQSQQPVSILESRPDAPRELVRICQKMMAKSPVDRYASAAEVSRDLSEWRRSHQRLRRAVPLSDEELEVLSAEESSPIGGVPDEAGGRGWPWPMLAGLGVVVLAVVLVVGFWLRLDGRRVGQGEEDPLPANGKATSEIATQWPGIEGLPKDMAAGEPAKPGISASKLPTKAAPNGDTSPPTKLQPPPPGPSQVSTMKKVDPKPEVVESNSPTGAVPSAPSKPSQPADNPPGKAVSPKAEKQETAPSKADAEPFREFPEEVDLPLLTEKSRGREGPVGAADLARVHTAPGTAWTVRLLGGEDALRGSRRLVLVAREGDRTSWAVRAETAGGKEEESVEVGTFSRNGDTLRFAWSEAISPPVANSLRNCVLVVEVGADSRRLALRKPEVLEPITFDLQRGVFSHVIPLDVLPETGLLHLELLTLEGREGYRLQPPGPLSVGKPALLAFLRKTRQGRETPAVEFRIVMAKRPKLIVDLKLVVPTQFGPALSLTRRSALEEGVKTLGQEIPKTQAEAKKYSMQQQLEMAELQLWYDDFIKAVHRKAKLHFRIVIDVDGQPLVLAKTAVPAAKEAKSPVKPTGE